MSGRRDRAERRAWEAEGQLRVLQRKFHARGATISALEAALKRVTKELAEAKEEAQG